MPATVTAIEGATKDALKGAALDPAPSRAPQTRREAFQHIDGGKWHRVWWPRDLEAIGTIVTHVGFYQPDRDSLRPLSEVPVEDRCRRCFRTPTPATPASQSDQSDREPS